MTTHHSAEGNDFKALIRAYRRGRLLLVWANLPFAFAAQPPANRALLLNEWIAQSGGSHPGLIEGLPHVPPLSILSMDPTDRIERAFREAGVPLQVVSSRREVPAQGCHNLLKLGGDLASRRGVILSRAELRELGADPDKAYLLAEARRIVKGGALLLLGANPAGEDFQAWWAVLASALDPATAWALGPPEAGWSAGVTPLAVDFATLAAELAALALEVNPSIQSEEGGPMSQEDKLIAIHQRRLQILREKEATYGINAPPEILIEIEDLEAKIRALQGGARPAAPRAVAPVQPGSTVYNINIQHATGMAIGDGARVEQSGSGLGQPPGQAAEAGSPWNTNAIRDLLTTAFDDTALTALCFDYFQPVYEEFAAGMTRSQKIQRLLDYCRRYGQVEELLGRIKDENPVQYHRFEAQLRR